MQKFKLITNIPNYEIGDSGIMRNINTKRVLKCFISNGYERVRITYKRKKVSFRIHRLVAEAFIPNPLNLPIVNHKDGNRRNNNHENLEWINEKDNILHGLNRRGKDIILKLYKSKKWNSLEEFIKEINNL